MRLACLIEATSRKAGNVHPGMPFEHLAYEDFVRSAEAVAPVLPAATELGVGRTVLECIEATRAMCSHNTNLGIVLLLAPLCAVPAEIPLRDGVQTILEALTTEDAEAVYAAIRLAAPRGLGDADEEDVAGAPSRTLSEAMSLAQDRDLIARQYTSGFDLVFRFADTLSRADDFRLNWEQSTIELQLRLMADTPDTDILRKCGPDIATQSAALARDVLDAMWPESVAGARRFKEFDEWLRADGSQRNPGTTADIVTACLFVALREKQIAAPSREELQERTVWIRQHEDRRVFAIAPASTGGDVCR